MLDKPEGCKGCPFYAKNPWGFIDDEVPSSAKVVVYFDHPDMKTTADSAAETMEAEATVRKYLPYAQLNAWDVGFAHVLRCKQYMGAKGKPLADAKKHCRQYDEINDDSIVVTTGPMGWKLFSQNQPGSRNDWRSYYVNVEHNKTADSIGLDNGSDDEYNDSNSEDDD